MGSLSTNKGLTLPTVGGDAGTWGTENNATINAVDGITGAVLTTSVTGSSGSGSGINFTAAQTQSKTFKFTGNLGTNYTATLMSSVAPGDYVIDNEVTYLSSLGTFTMSATTSSSVAVALTVPAGRSHVQCDGTSLFPADAGYIAANTVASSVFYGSTPFLPYLAVNTQLVASVAGNILTVALKNGAGSDPSASNPVMIPFRDTTLANGDPVWVNVSSALSISTFAVGASLGSTNGVPFRFWVVAFNNAGTAVLALVNCSTATQIYPLVDANLQSTTQMTAGATAAGTFYTPNGTALVSKAFTILGYIEYATGLVTAGTYNNAPSKVQLFGPGAKKPGDVVQTVYTTNTGTTAASNTTKVATGTTATITPTTAANLVKVAAHGQFNYNAGANPVVSQISRGSGPTLIGNIATWYAADGTNGATGAALYALDTPATTSATTYTVYIWMAQGAASNAIVWLGTASSIGTNTGVMQLEEIMG